eukprot:SAG11_NODE_36681_length_260_cov_0.956522_1_plen_64_part_10
MATLRHGTETPLWYFTTEYFFNMSLPYSSNYHRSVSQPVLGDFGAVLGKRTSVHSFGFCTGLID